MALYLLPLALLFVAIVVIAWMIARKVVYLKKLAPDTLEETITTDSSFLAEMYPEIAAGLKKINLRAYGVNLLNEIEKLLRKLRLISLKIDTHTNKLIGRVRKSTVKHEEILIKEAEKEGEKAVEAEILDYEELGDSEEELKQKEQLLIIEIAKNPKDMQLYKELGVIYMRLNNWEDAKQSFEKASELDPADENVKRKLGRVLAKMGGQREK